jgi:hypothetical protein
MITPTKYTDIDLSVIGLSFEILKLLLSEDQQKYGQILSRIVSKRGESAKENFLLALSFLYLLGKIQYYPKEDVIELIKNTQ